jgi:Mrp family chromosome partitioning ATPase
MEHIRKAVERAKGFGAADTLAQEQTGVPAQQQQFPPAAGITGSAQPWGQEIVLSAAQLESNRIISYDVTDQRSKSFDMLRTQVLQSMSMKSWQVLGITSATAGCGKSTIAANLALSISRQPGRSVLLIDMDLQKPQIAKSLGLRCEQGLLSVLKGKSRLPSAMIQACINNQKFLVLPCEASTLNSSEWMSSRSMAAVMQEIKRDYRAWTVILDLPPMLIGDDVISILSQIDCILFVAAAGASTVQEIKECTKHLESTSLVRVVLNKSVDITSYYYSRYGNYAASDMKT